MDIQNNVFIVTGGASGLGAATAENLVQIGAKVVIADLNEVAGKALVTRLGSQVKLALTDVADEESAIACFEVARDFGEIRGVINCAGIAPAESILKKETPHQLCSFIRTININLVGTFNILRLAALYMSQLAENDKGERGVIINTASVAAYEGQFGQAAYAASKGGIVSLTLPAARELARYGIRVMTIAPGIMETPMLRGMPEHVQEALEKMIPFPSRMGKANEYALLVEHIIENSYLNGEVIRLDAAVRMGAK